jgi:hypothetical protein
MFFTLALLCGGLFLLMITTACGDDDDGGEEAPTNLPMFSECGSIDECLHGEEEGWKCEATPISAGVTICTTDCETAPAEVLDPEVGACETPAPSDLCDEGCCYIESVEVINDFGDEKGYGVCVPQTG